MVAFGFFFVVSVLHRWDLPYTDAAEEYPRALAKELALLLLSQGSSDLWSSSLQREECPFPSF